MQWLKSGIGQLWPPPVRFQDSGMTVIAGSYSEAGFAIGADGQGTWTDGRHNDEEQKIFSACGNDMVAAFGVTGVMANGDGTFSIIREVTQVAEEMQGVKGIVRYEDYVQHFAQRVIGRMKSARDRKQFDFVNDDGFISRFLFCGYFLKRPFSYASTIRTNDGTDLSEVGEPRPFQRSPWGSLSTAVANLVYGSLDPRFSRYRVRIDAHSSLADNVRCVEKLIEACMSPPAKEVDPERCADLGGKVHVATVTPDEGFRWSTPPPANPKG